MERTSFSVAVVATVTDETHPGIHVAYALLKSYIGDVIKVS
jgi:hypothetical protein